MLQSTIESTPYYVISTTLVYFRVMNVWTDRKTDRQAALTLRLSGARPNKPGAYTVATCVDT